MNHAVIATQALRYRLHTLGVPIDDATQSELERTALEAVCRADPETDTAIRRLGTAWVRAGLPSSELTEPWVQPAVEAIFEGDPHLVDALDTLMARIHFHSPVSS